MSIFFVTPAFIDLQLFYFLALLLLQMWFKEYKSHPLLRMQALHPADNITYTLRKLYTLQPPSHELFISFGLLQLLSVRVLQVRGAAASSLSGEEQRQGIFFKILTWLLFYWLSKKMWGTWSISLMASEDFIAHSHCRAPLMVSHML